MGFLDIFSRRGGRAALTLDAARMDRWPERLVRHRGLAEDMQRFVDEVEHHRKAVEYATTKLGDPMLLKKVPERAQPVYDEHLPLIRKEVQDLLDRTLVIDDLFLIEAQQQDFQSVLTGFKDRTRKSNAALNEYLGDELHLLNGAVQALEDAMLALYPKLDTAGFANIKKVKELVEDYKGTREKVRKLEALRERLSAELDVLEVKRLRHKEKIRFFSERARNSKYKELIAEEQDLLDQADAIKVKGFSEEEEAKRLEPINQRLAWLRKQMISDITAMNINEQRTFLEAAKDDIRLRQRKLERVEELLDSLSFDAYRPRLVEALTPLNARVEDADMIIEPEDEDVAPQ